MKIVMLLGSPHKNGSSNLLASQFVNGVREKGHDVSVIDAAHLNIRPCIGCEQCGTDGDCIHKDDNNKVRDALLAADMAVFVTPIYYFGMSAQLKTVIDRFYSYNAKLQAKHIRTALITAAWDSSPEVMACTAEHYKKLCDYMSFCDMGMILGTGCGTPDMTAKTEHMTAAYEFGKSI